MKRKPFNVLPALFSLLLCLTATQQNFGQTTPKHFYKYDVIASTSANLEVLPAPSINDFGDVAFAGRKTPGSGSVFLSKIGQSVSDLMPTLSAASNQLVGGRVQINDAGEVIENSAVAGTSPAQNYLRRIEGVDNFTILAAANGAGGFNDFDQIYFNSISINNFGEPVFSTRQGNNTTVLTTGERPNFSTLQFPSTGDTLRPMAGDDCAVLRAGASPTDPLRIYNYDLAGFQTIASAADGFTAIGQSPSVSRLCEVVVFYGDLNAAGAQTLGTNPGPGIFAWLDTDGAQGKIVRLAGRLIEDNSAPGGNDDGFCDAGETCVQGELGFTQSGNPIFFNSFDANNRVAVAHQSVGAPGVEDDIFVVSFLGTPNTASDNPARPFTNQPGLWTLTTQIKNENGVLREKPLAAVPVIQVGDAIQGKTVTAINVYDQIASVKLPSSRPQSPNTPIPTPGAESPGDHRLAFHLSTNNGNLIVRAERNVETPVIFIPGITGSTLIEKSSSGSIIAERWIGNPLFIKNNLERLADLQSTSTNIVGTDALRRILNLPVVNPDRNLVYKPLLEDSLMVQGGLREYVVDGKEERRTYDGCDMSQQYNSPTLFIFAYDWRKGNAENAGKLKQYVECVQRFYPGTKVNIVAHSMGGLIARRYITQFPTNNSVEKLITIASPFLGAPKAIQAMETGRLGFLWNVVEQNLPAFATDPVRTLSINSTAVHELLPTEAYFTLGGRPFVEKTFDINGDGIVNQTYDYSQFSGFYDARFPFVYSTNQNFHSYRNQDDWSQDTSGVQYFHITGRESFRNTVESVTAKPTNLLSSTSVRRDFQLDIKMGKGDGTVPQLSAERISSNQNMNAPTASLIRFVAVNKAENKLANHVGLVKSQDVRDEVLNILGVPYQNLNSAKFSDEKEQNMKRVVVQSSDGVVNNADSEAEQQGYYFKISGVERINITDDEGNTNTPVGDAGFELAVPGVNRFGGSYEPNNLGYHGLSMVAEEGTYTVRFRNENRPLTIEIVRGYGNDSPNYAVRYSDLELPANVECLLTINPQGMEDLRYDSDGDGTFDAVVPAHVRVSGAAAQDVTAPNVSITQAPGNGETGLVTISAADSESGVKTIYWRYADEAQFKIYAAPFFPKISTRHSSRTVEAFADDNVGNRSSPVQTSVTNY